MGALTERKSSSQVCSTSTPNRALPGSASHRSAFGCRSPKHRVCLEVSSAPTLTRFEMGSLGPLVPRVDEDEIFVGSIRSEGLCHVYKPFAVQLGRRALEDQGTVRPSRRVVPAKIGRASCRERV